MRQLRKIHFVMIGISILSLAILSAGCGAAATPTAAPTSKVKVAYLFGGVVNDASFNQLGYQSMQSAQKKITNMETAYAEKTSPTDAPRAMREYLNNGYQIIWLHGGEFVDPAVKTAADFPKASFVVYGGAPIPNAPPNLWNIANKQGWAEGFYLAGVVAGMTTKTNKLGFVGGIKLPVYAAALDGFTLGAKSVNPNIEVFSVFTGNFDDGPKAKEAATAQIERGADIIAHALNLGFLGVVEAAKAKPGTLLIGKDIDQSSVDPNLVITSVILDYGLIMADIIPQITKGTAGGFYASSVAKGAIYITPPASKLTKAETAAKAETAKKDITSGTLVVTVP